MNSHSHRVVHFGILSLLLLGLVGCGPSRSVNPWALRKENAQLKAALRQYQDQVAREKTRADNLDADNERMQTMLAEEQESRRQFELESSQTARVPPRSGFSRDADGYDDEPKEFGPAGRGAGRPAAPRGGDEDWLPMTNVAGAQVQRDGESLRIRVTNTSLFDPGKATLKPGATRVLDQVAASLRHNYAGQLVGIEGHTDADPIRKSNWKDNHDLSYQRARAVYEYLTARAGLPSNQLYIAAYGPNAPIANNGTSAGKAQNRRVEFVVRPDGWQSSGGSGGRR